MKEDLIKSAVSFLSSANVQTADRDKKVEFLKKKGLNDQEIGEAFKRVESDITLPKQTTDHVPQLPPRIAYNPTQIVHYPLEPIPRMTNRQLLRYVLIVGMGSFTITAALVLIIKKYISKIFNAIAAYQSNRYQQHTYLLNRMESTLIHYSTTTDDLQKAQEKLDNSLNRLLQSARELKQEGNQPYKLLRSTMERFTNSLSHNPLITNIDARNQFNYQSGFASSYADRYQVDTSHSLTVQNIKSEIRSVKGMLLSRRNFPVVSTAAPSPLISRGFVPPSPTIPDQSAYHPRIGRSFRNQLNTTVQDASP